MASNQKGVVAIKGKNYKLIVQRVNEFRQAHPEFGVETELLHHDEIRVVTQVRIFDEQGRIRGSGVAEEFREASRINQTSAMENCETSAFGRALASMGYGGDVAYASAEEVVNAIQNDTPQKIIDHNMAVKEYMHEIYEIKVSIAKEDYTVAAGYWHELGEEVQTALHLAPTKGGIWETHEFPMLKADGAVGKAVTQLIKDNQKEAAA
jgi:hypothetical protein